MDTSSLVGERLAEFERDRAESNRRYNHAFQVVLSHTSVVELDEFWRLFATASDQGLGGDETDLDFVGENPMALSGKTNEPMMQSVVCNKSNRDSSLESRNLIGPDKSSLRSCGKYLA